MKALKRLSSEAAIYGMPSIIGRFLNWWLTPYYTFVLANEAQLGTVINIYAYVAFIMVILTLGLETGYFRFASKENDKEKVYSTSLLTLFISSISFIILVSFFNKSISSFLDLSSNPEFIVLMGVTVALDAFSSIPFAKLRLSHRPIKFAVIKFVNIGLNIVLNLFFLTVCPLIIKHFPNSIINSIYDSSYGIGYIFISNFISTLITLLLLYKEIFTKIYFDKVLMYKMITYSFPILIVGITGMINMNIDKILLPELLPESSEPLKQLGIYGASFKMAVLMNMFIQAFRYAFEPFFFSQKNNDESKSMYIIVMKYFSIIGIIIFLIFSLYIDVFKHLIEIKYREGIGIVPLVLFANLFMGIYFNLSLWYKVTDKTRYGAYLGIFGSIISLIINILFIPTLGYYASAIAILVCFVSMTILSYIIGQRHYKINYDVKNFLFYLFLSIALYLFYWYFRTNESPKYWLSTLLISIFFYVLFVKEKKDLVKIFRK